MVNGLTETKRDDGSNDTLIPHRQFVPYSLITIHYPFNPVRHGQDRNWNCVLHDKTTFSFALRKYNIPFENY